MEHRSQFLALINNFYISGTDERKRRISEVMIRKQVEYCTHIGLEFVLIPFENSLNLARLYTSLAKANSFTWCVMRVGGRDWASWNRVRVLSNHSPRIGVGNICLLLQPVNNINNTNTLIIYLYP